MVNGQTVLNDLQKDLSQMFDPGPERVSEYDSIRFYKNVAAHAILKNIKKSK